MFWHEHWEKVLGAILLLPIISVLLFIYWIKQKEISIETAKAYWEIFIKLISAFTVIISGAMLFGKYIDQQEQVHYTRESEIKRELALKEANYYRQQLNYDLENFKRSESLLREAKKLVARIAATESPDQDLTIRFDELYHADLIGVEKPGGAVVDAMIDFRDALIRNPPESRAEMNQLSLALSTAVETEILQARELINIQHEKILKILKDSELD